MTRLHSPGRTGAKKGTIVFACILSFVAAMTALGYGWSGRGEASVRFNPYVDSARDFELLPPLPRSLIADKEAIGSSEDYGAYRYGIELIEQVNKLWQDAGDAKSHGDLNTLRRLLRLYLDRTAAPRETVCASNGLRSYYETVKFENRQKRRNSAVDQLDAMMALEQGSSPSNIRRYLAARDVYDEGGSVEEVARLLDALSGDPNLSDNVAYLRAALQYRARSYKEALKSFAELAGRYRGSEKRDAALYMNALATLKLSISYDAPYIPTTTDLEEPVSSRKDAAWHAAREGFQRLMREYNGGRYFNDARGWLAYMSYRVGDWPDALVEYYRMLGDPRDLNSRLEGAFSLHLVRVHARELDMRKVEARLVNEPEAALAYAYHEIYNYATGLCDEPYPLERERDKRAAARDEALKRVAAFSGVLADRPGATAAFVLTAAMANLQVGQDHSASRMARRTLQLGVSGEQRSQALWVQGIADHRRGEFKSALDSIRRLIADKPSARFRGRAERYLPIILEDMGDLEGALEHYLEKGYSADAAYFIDVLMMPEQLAYFIETHPMNAKRDELLYGLGVRYLRDRRWKYARHAFSRVRTTGRAVDDDYNLQYYQYGFWSDKRTGGPKQGRLNPAIEGVRPQWIDQDLRTADDLERLEREIELAQGDEAKAEALYQLGSYQYQGSLLFYNPLAWRGERHDHLFNLDERGLFRQPGESRTLFKSIQSHDAASRALDVFLDVVRRFPHTRAARDALYTAAVCHERLANYNPYWRGVYARGEHAGQRMVTYEDVKTAYPDYQLPRGTHGWEPATRTVNGGPGWQEPPKPPKRLSRLQRHMLPLATLGLLVKRQTDRATVQLVQISAYVFWLQVKCLLIGITGFLWYSAFKAKRLLVAELSERGWPKAQIRPVERNGCAELPSGSYRSLRRKDVPVEWCRRTRRYLANARWMLLHTRTGTLLVLNIMLYGSAVVFLLMFIKLLVLYGNS